MLDPMRRYAQSWGIKIVFGVIILVFVFWGVGSFRGDKASVLARVNGQPVLIKDFEKAYQQNLRLVKNKNPKITDKELEEGGFRRQVFSNMVTTQLLEAEAKRLGITVSADELRAEIAKLPVFHGKDKKFDPKRYEAILRVNGATPADFEADFRQNMLLERLAGYITLPATTSTAEVRSVFDFMREQATIQYIAFKTEDFGKQVSPTEDEIAKYYKDHKQEFATPVKVKIDYVNFTPKSLAKPDAVSDADVEAYYKANPKKFARPEEVRVRHFLIMLPPNSSKDAIAKATAKLNEIAAKLRKGADFASLAPKKANNPDGLLSEDWAWLPKGSLPKEFAAFEKAAFALKPNEVSAVVRTTLGLHLIQAGEHKAAGEEPLAEAKDDIRKQLAEQRASDKVSKALDEMQDKVASGTALAKAAEEQHLPVETSKFFSKVDPPRELGLSEQALSVLFSLKKGETSDSALPTQDGFVLVKLVDVQPAGFEPLEAVKDVVKGRLVADGAGRLAKAKADAVAKALANADTRQKTLDEYKDKIRVSQPFTRQGFIPGLGLAPLLVQTVFETQKTDWLPTAYGVHGGYLVAGLEKRIPASDALWEKEKGRWMTTMLQTKRSELVRAYLEAVQQSAKIEVLNQSMLGPAPAAQK